MTSGLPRRTNDLSKEYVGARHDRCSHSTIGLDSGHGTAVIMSSLDTSASALARSHRNVNGHGLTGWNHCNTEAAQNERVNAASAANADDAAVWRWFAALVEERRLRWRCAFGVWEVHVDRKRVASGRTFYDAIRHAKVESRKRGLGEL